MLEADRTDFEIVPVVTLNGDILARTLGLSVKGRRESPIVHYSHNSHSITAKSLNCRSRRCVAYGGAVPVVLHFPKVLCEVLLKPLATHFVLMRDRTPPA